MRAEVLRPAGRHRWIWSALGILMLWLCLSLLTERVSLHALAGVATSASFLLVAVLGVLGQVVVVTTGRGIIDLSIPSVMTLLTFATVTASADQDERLGLAVAVVLGLLTGLLNAALVTRLRISAIIATLATGYMLATATLLVNRGLKTNATPEALGWLASGRVAGIPVVALLALGLALLASTSLARLACGRHLSAVGQSATAARLSGTAVGRTTSLAFVTSALLAALAGMLLSACSGDAFLEMGSPYLLQTVGAVVLGGTLIAGRSATPLGTLFGSLLLVLIIVTMQVAGLPLGAQDIVQGLVILLILARAGPARTHRPPFPVRSRARTP